MAQPYAGLYLSGVPSSEREVKAHRTISRDGVNGAGAPIHLRLQITADIPLGVVGVSWLFR
jgi:hypothetical protein